MAVLATIHCDNIFGVSAQSMKKFDHPPRKSPPATRCQVWLQFVSLLLDSDQTHLARGGIQLFSRQAHFSSPHSSHRAAVKFRRDQALPRQVSLLAGYTKPRKFRFVRILSNGLELT